MGGCASKPKDSDSRKVPAPALRKPHAPPEIPVDSPKAAAETVPQEKKDGDENKETSSEPAPKTKEPETTEEKPITVPVEVNPAEAKVETYELTREEKKEVAETVVPTEVAETVVPREEQKEVAENVVPKEEKKEAAETVVPKEEKKEIAENVVPLQDKKEVAAA